MPTINSANLKALRAQRRMTLDDLSQKSKVDRGTIHRIEADKRSEVRQRTIEALARALLVEPDVLTGPTIDSEAAEPSRKSQMNIRMADEARNALALVALRYNVKASSIVHLAPLLFLWVAEESLKRRTARLDELEAHWDASPPTTLFKHLDGAVSWSSRADEIARAERASVAKRDLFGLHIPDDVVAWDYEESEHNPMAQFLADLAASLPGLVDFEHWSPNWDQPGYTLGRQEALELVDGDDEAVHHIVCGNVGLHEVPKDVSVAGPAAVAEWVRARGDEYVAGLVKMLEEIEL